MVCFSEGHFANSGSMAMTKDANWVVRDLKFLTLPTGCLCGLLIWHGPIVWVPIGIMAASKMS